MRPEEGIKADQPKLERVLDRSIKAFFPGLLRMDRFAREMSAVTRVMVILENKWNGRSCCRVRVYTDGWFKYVAKHQRTYLPSNLCFKKSNRAFCIMSVTWRRKKVRVLDQKVNQLEFFFVQYKDGGKRTSKPFRDGPIRITGRIVGTTSYMATCSPCRHHPASHEEHVCLITHSCTIGFSSGFWLAALKTDQEFRSHSQNVLQYAAGLNARTTSLLCCRARSAGAL